MRVSEEWLAQYQAKQRKPELQDIIKKHGFKGAAPAKYRNKKVDVDGIIFDSAKEARRWGELKALAKVGAISALERQKVYVLAPSVVLNGRTKPALKYICDFYYLCRREGGYVDEVVEDVKSPATRKLPAFRIKAHLMKSVHNVDITEI